MGLNQNTIDLVLFLRRQELFPDHTAVVEIGAQQLSNSLFRYREGLAALEHVFGIKNPFPGQPTEIAPATGAGLINYNPKWFWMLARSNGYEILHMDYRSTYERPPLPENMVDYISTFTPDFAARAEQYGAADAGLVVALCKRHDIEFVPPLDVPDAVTTGHPALAARYWTVLQAGGQARLREHRHPVPLLGRIRRLVRGVGRGLRLLRRLITS